MKKIHVARDIFTSKSTIGDLYFDGEFQCATLEDTIRNVKLVHETAIPAGDYDLELRFSGKFNRVMPFLLNVPFFEGIMIHWGNNAESSWGCILVGVKDGTPDWISSSRRTFDALYAKIEQTINSGEKISVSITGGLRKDEFLRAKTT